MVDRNPVCCMCGDVGFPDKLFRCMRCLSRFQHNYCTNYYEDTSTEPPRICDWCRSEDHTTGKHKLHSKKVSTIREGTSGSARSNYNSCERIKQDNDHEEVSSKGRNISSSTSSKSSGRRYKLLKNILS